ncbi:MAG TPA: ATP-binding protein [Longimicrobiaceae bacterium]|nr:ATP-binding protein [Longimicrobiaceae bacterium]
MEDRVEGERSPVLRRWGAATLLGVAGYLLNQQPLPLSPGTDLLFGGVAYLLAAVALGPGPGLLAAAIASARTLWLWDHPYAWLIFSLEGAAVGWLSHSRGRRPLVADLLYWTLAGVPLLFLTYGMLLDVGGSTAAVLFLKQPFNGLINALGAEALFLLPRVRRVLRGSGEPRLRSALAVVVTLAAVTPALGFGVWSGRQEWERSLGGARERAVLFSRSYAASLGQYVDLHERAVRSVAESVELRGELDPVQLQRLLAAEREEFPGFGEMYAADSRDRVLAAHPLRGPRGEARVGADASGPGYVGRLRETRETVVSDVLAGGAGGPRVALAHPVLLGDTLAGYVVGELELGALPPPVAAPDSAERFRVAAADGALIFDSGAPGSPAGAVRTLRGSRVFAAVRALGGSGTTTFRSRDASTPAGATAAQVLAGAAAVPGLDWMVWTEQPYPAIQAAAAESYVRLLALLIVVTLLALGVSDALAAYLSGPLLRLREASGALAAGALDARVGRLPEAAPLEIRELSRAFDEMAASLAGRTEELEELGEIARSLASTLDADELLRRITDAATRLVDPDGCGIALLRPGGGALRAADYTLGLLAPSAGREIPLEESVIGWVVRQESSVLLPDAASDPRIRRAYIDPAVVGSVMCSPLVGRSGPLGTLTAVRARSGEHPFTPADLRLLERLARHAAVAVENANLVAAERRRAGESEAIRRVARTVSAAQGLGETLAVVAREAGRIVRSEACTVALLRYDGDGEERLEVVAVSGAAESPPGAVLPLEGRLLRGPVHDLGPAVEGARYEASVPLRVGEETLGVLTAMRCDEPFGAADAALLAALADHAAVALRNARLLDAAQDASRAKSDFIATMSHELRTPLNAVLGHLQLLEMEIHGPVTEEQRSALGRIGAASRHLRGLIEEVLSFARLEAGRTEVRITEADLGALAEEVAAVIEPLAREKDLDFRIERQGGATVPTDADKVRQILINLAGNAVKFTERGEVRIRVEPRDGEVVLAVADTGPGIAPRDRARLFRPFEQLQSGFSRAHEGTGLGLYLSGRYAALIGGRIEVESEPGRGSVFSLVLPRSGPPHSGGGEPGEDDPERGRPAA